MVTDLLGGQVEWGITALPSVQGHIKTGALRAIGVNGKARLAAAPEIPTLAEQGLPDYDAEAWFAVIGPARMPAAQVRRIHAGFVAAFATPEAKEAMAKQGNTIEPVHPKPPVRSSAGSSQSTQGWSSRQASRSTRRHVKIDQMEEGE